MPCSTTPGRWGSAKNGPAYFAGSVDEVCLSDRVLTPGEVGVLAGKKE